MSTSNLNCAQKKLDKMLRGGGLLYFCNCFFIQIVSDNNYNKGDKCNMEVAIFLLVFVGAVYYFLFKQIKREGYSIWPIVLLLLIGLLLNMK